MVLDTLRCALAAIALAMLTACGGGDPDTDDGAPDVPPPAVNCNQQPRPTACL